VYFISSSMTWWQSLILGIIEGITEYLPVSSTGHLIVAQRLMGIGVEGAEAKEAADAYAIAIQAGAILAVLGIYFPRVVQMFKGLLGKDEEGKKLIIAMIVAFLPAAVAGLTLNDWIKSYLFGIWPVVMAWIIGGVGILLISKWQREHKGGVDLSEITWKMALIIGLLQCVAMCPGTSRSLMTIVGGLAVGLSLSAAVEFSFLLGVLTLGAATAKDTLDSGELMLELFGWQNLLIGGLAALVSAVIAVRWLVDFLKSNGLQIFGYYRITLGVIVGGLILAQVVAF